MWEELKDNSHGLRTERLRVPGGWLVRTYIDQSHVVPINQKIGSVAICFVPDSQTTWELS